MTHIISATFKTPSAASYTLDELDKLGLTEEQISLVTSDQTRGKSFNLEIKSKSTEAASIGGVGGGLVGGILAALMATGAIAIPGLSLASVGTFFATAAGVGMGATAGGLGGFLVGRGIPEYVAVRYEDSIKNGGTLLVVECVDHAQTKSLARLFERVDAHNVWQA